MTVDIRDLKAWRDKPTLEYLYGRRGMAAEEVGDVLGCSKRTVLNWLHRLDVPVRPSNIYNAIEANRRGPVPFCVNPQTDYELWLHTYKGERTRVYVQQLMAIGDGYDPHDVFDPDTVVHHIKAHPRANWPGNFEVMSRSEHTAQHMREYWDRQAGTG